MLRFLACLISAPLLVAQPPVQRETVIVTGAFEPVSIEELDRSVRLLPVREWELLSNSIADFLRLDPSLDLRQRSPNGLQSDLSIRGGTFGQTLVLIDGQRVSDPQSGHHNLDIPLPAETIDRIEVLRGAGSTWYGSDAVGGVVNLITRTPESAEVRLRTSVGNFGVNQQRGAIAWTAPWARLSQRLAFSRDFSSGFIPNRDYRNLSFAATTHLVSPLGASDVTLAYNDRPFGAERFYGNFNSWENTKTWYAALRQGLGEKTAASLSFRRHSDLFVLYRDRPEVFANHHSAESWFGTIRRHESIGSNTRLSYGAEGFRDAIVSNNLGSHSRVRGAAYGSIDMRALRRFSLSLGVREEVYRSLSSQLSPSASGGVWLTEHLKLRGGVSLAFRVPSYTDLYYHDPANLGSPDLRPEKAWSYEGGVDWNAGGRLRGEVVVFHRRETDGIDYVRRSPTDIWRATNFQKLRFTGVEAGVSARLARTHQVDLNYTGLRGARAAVDGIVSKYVFNYPVHSGIASWNASLPKGILARTRIGGLERLARDPYAVWDLYVARAGRRLKPFVQFTNLTGTGYEEIPGVVMPGRAVVAGFEIAIH